MVQPVGLCAARNGHLRQLRNGTLRGPGLASLDFSLQKSFRIGSTQSMDLRGEFLNLTNTPILNGPNRAIGPTLGLLQSSQGARNVQVALRYRF
jgi:hypothetical protein